MGIIDSIKSNVAKSGTNKEKILYVKSDSKVRVRFLQEFDEGYQFTFHDSYEKGINTICQEELGKNCPLCGDDSLRTRSLYAWSVYNIDSKKVEIMLFAVNNCTPVSGLLSMYENYGTIMDRDYVLQKSGKQQNTTYTVIPMDKERFRNTKAKPYTKSAILKILDKAYPLSDEYANDLGDEYEYEEEEYDEEEKEGVERKARKKNNNKNKSKKKSNNRKLTFEEVESILEDEDIDEDDFIDYYEVDSIEDFGKMSRTELKELIDEYIDYLDEEE